MVQSRTVLSVTLCLVVVSAGCLGGSPPESSDGDTDAVPAGSAQQGHVVVNQAEDAPEDAVDEANETIQSTKPIQDALDEYRNGESGPVLAVEGDQYNETRSALQTLVDKGAPTRRDQPGPNTYVELETETVYVGMTANGTV